MQVTHRRARTQEYTTIAKLISRAANKVNDARAALVVRVGERVARVSEELLTTRGRELGLLQGIP